MAQRLVDMGIVPLTGIEEAIAAMEIAAALGRPRPPRRPLLLPPAPAPGHTLTEAGAKAALANCGLRIPRSDRAQGAQAAAQAAARIGFPVVLKGEGIAHKSDAGAVALNLATGAAVIAAAQAMPTADFLVEEMVTDAVAELLVGVVADPAHGYVLTLAAGGVLAELLQDSVSLLLPADRDAVADALARLRLWPVLAGYRGRPAADLGAILDAVMAVQAHVETALPQEIEINPLICTPQGAVAADALIRTGGTA